MRSTQPLMARYRRLPLSTKQASKGFYKGSGTGVLGSWDQANPRQFVPNWSKVRTYVYPETGIKGFTLTPFVSKNVNAKYIEEEHGTWSIPAKTFTGKEYLSMWKHQGGHDVVDVPAEEPKK